MSVLLYKPDNSQITSLSFHLWKLNLKLLLRILAGDSILIMDTCVFAAILM